MKLFIVFSFSFLLLACVNTAQKPVEEAPTNVNSAFLQTGLLEYTPFDFAQHQQSEKPFVVFVNAEWCGTCLDQLQEMHLNKSWIPEGMTIMIADYDKDLAFRQEYKIPDKHTAAYFDAEGEHVRNERAPLFPDMITYLKDAHYEARTACASESGEC